MMEVKDASSGENQVIIQNKRYEGYCVDLMYKIGQLLKFKHTFELVKDNNYGSYDPLKKTWNGLVKRILDRVSIIDRNYFKNRAVANILKNYSI